MRFVIYKNSVLATLCSMFGAAFIALAVTAMISGELDILSGICMIVVGVGFMWLGDFISTKKAERKRKKAQQADVLATASTENCTQPRKFASNANDAPVQSKPVNKIAVGAGVLFLLAVLLDIWSVFSPHSRYVNKFRLLECVSYLLMAIGCFQMKRTQRANVFQVIGMAGPAAISAYSLLQIVRASGEAYVSTYTLMLLGSVILAFLLMLLFTVCAMKPRGAGGVTGALWFLPSVLLMAQLIVRSNADHSLNQALNDFVEHPRWMPYPVMLELFLDIHLIAACFLAGLCFWRVCRSSMAISRMDAPFVQPELQQASSVQPVQQEHSSAAPKPPQKANNLDVEKQIRAYRDLMDCGIMTQDECEEKIRELMQDYYGGK